MKRFNYLLSMLLVLAMCGPSCKKFNLNTDDLDITLNLDIIKTNIGIHLYEAVTERLIGDNEEVQATITIHGQDSVLVLDPSGDRYSSYTSSGGYVGLALDPYLHKPTEASPVVFNAVIKVEGFLTTSIPIKITSEGIFEFDIKLIEIAMPPDGVSVSVVDHFTEVTDGLVDETVEITTDASEVKVTIESGTLLKDEEGNPLEGNLDVVLVYFDPMNEDALEVFPGGMNVIATNENGVPEEVNFISAGFIALEITDASGRQAAFFDLENIQIDIVIPQGLINPETGVPVKDGDPIPLWSYETYDGEWKWEGTVILEGSPEMLIASFSLPHLSYWNLDWKGTNCDDKYIIFTGDQSLTQQTKYRLSATLVGGGGYLYGDSEYLFPGQRIRLVNIPTSPVQVTFEPYYNTCGITPQWQIPASFTWNFCANGDYTIELTPNSILTINAQVIIHCTDTNQDIVPTQSIKGRFRKQGSTCWTEMWIGGGAVNVAGIEINATYEVQAYYQGKWQPDPAYTQTLGNETTVIFRPAIKCQ